MRREDEKKEEEEEDDDELSRQVLAAVNDPRNERLLQWTSRAMSQFVREVIDALPDVPLADRRVMYAQLIDRQSYRFVERARDLREGTFLRWIPLDPPYELARGALFCRTHVDVDGHVHCVLRGVHFPPRFFQRRFDQFLFFQKLTRPERLVLLASDVLCADDDDAR